MNRVSIPGGGQGGPQIPPSVGKHSTSRRSAKNIFALYEVGPTAAEYSGILKIWTAPTGHLKNELPFMIKARNSKDVQKVLWMQPRHPSWRPSGNLNDSVFAVLAFVDLAEVRDGHGKKYRVRIGQNGNDTGADPAQNDY